jgi:hypothetical protein
MEAEKQKPITEEYRRNWERVFATKSQETKQCTKTNPAQTLAESKTLANA